MVFVLTIQAPSSYFNLISLLVKPYGSSATHRRMYVMYIDGATQA